MVEPFVDAANGNSLQVLWDWQHNSWHHPDRRSLPCSNKIVGTARFDTKNALLKQHLFKNLAKNEIRWLAHLVRRHRTRGALTLPSPTDTTTWSRMYLWMCRLLSGRHWKNPQTALPKWLDCAGRPMRIQNQIPSRPPLTMDCCKPWEMFSISNPLFWQERIKSRYTSKKFFWFSWILLSGIQVSLVTWSTSKQWRWLNVPRPTSCPLILRLQPSSNSVPNARLSAVAQSIFVLSFNRSMRLLIWLRSIVGWTFWSTEAMKFFHIFLNF